MTSELNPISMRKEKPLIVVVNQLKSTLISWVKLLISTIYAWGIWKLKGGKYDSYNTVLNRLKYNAWKKCGNAVINITTETIQRKDGNPEDGQPQEYYNSTVIKGLLVKADIDNVIEYKSDTTYARTVRREINSERTTSVVTLLGGAIAGIVWLFTVEPEEE